MNLKELKEIITIFEEADISELDLEREGMRIKLKKGLPTEVMALSRSFEGEVPGVVLKDTGIPALSEKAGKKSPGKSMVEISSPMVGTFYRSPSPETKPFVEEGDEVQEGDVICIIEAMKLMNEIKAERSGRVAKVLVENGHPVEFGQVLFILEPK